MALPNFAQMDKWQLPGSASNLSNWESPRGTGIQHIQSPLDTWNFGVKQAPTLSSAQHAANLSALESDRGIGVDSVPDIASKTGGTGGLPEMLGKWKTPVEMGVGIAQAGVGIYNAMEQSKMNDFMKSYYKGQEALQKSDYANAARSANEALSSRYGRQLDAQGITGAAHDQQQAAYMDKWGADTSF